MLSYIVPPIIIVLSLAVLIVFLFKKFSKRDYIEQNIIEGLSLRSSSSGVVSMFFSSISSLWFRSLEKMMQKTKLFSLKMHNASNQWFHSLKNKREKNIQLENQAKNIGKIENEIVKDIEEKDENIRQVDVVKKPIESIEKKRKFFVKKPKKEKEEIAEEAQVTQEVKPKRRGFFSRKNRIDMTDRAMENEDTEEVLIKKIADDPKNSVAYEKLGDYYAEMKSYRDSIECYKQVLKLNPERNAVRMKMRNLEVNLRK